MFDIQDDDLRLCECCNWEVAPEILHWHHDHMVDYPKQLLRKALGSDWQTIIRHRDENVTFFLEGLKRFVIRFEPVQICKDCNEADPNAKRLVGAHMTLFSFAAPEVRSFSDFSDCHAVPWRIDHAKADAFWKQQKPHFERRLRFVEKTVAAILNRDFWIAPRYSHRKQALEDA